MVNGIMVNGKRKTRTDYLISGDAPAAADVLEAHYRGFPAAMVQSQFHHAGTLGLGAETVDDIAIKEASV